MATVRTRLPLPTAQRNITENGKLALPFRHRLGYRFVMSASRIELLICELSVATVQKLGTTANKPYRQLPKWEQLVANW